MSEQFSDDLARGLDEGSISRGQALKCIGAGAVALAIGPLFPQQAEALTRKQRRAKVEEEPEPLHTQRACKSVPT